jgi:phospholipid/cholesterol/gamma-HCH transport system substrate-binding protein
MDERVMQFRVGVMFLATFFILGTLLVLFGKLPTFIPGRSYTVRIQFENAGGVSAGTPIRKSGILIGRIESVKLTEEDSQVLVTASIDGDKKIYTNEEAFISRDLLGDSALVFLPNLKFRGPREPIDPEKILRGRVSNDPTGLMNALKSPIDTVQNTGEALTAASVKLGAAAQRVEDILNKDAQDNVRDILRDASKSLKVVHKILGDEANQDKLAEALQKLPKTIDNMNATFKATSDALTKFTEPTKPGGRTPVDRMVDTIEMTERTLRKFSESEDPNNPPPVEQIASAMENIGEITKLLRTIMTRMESGESSLGAMLRDRELYDRLNHAARNIEQVTRDLKPIVADARVISDKVARHPGVILRDAVKPSVGIKN